MADKGRVQRLLIIFLGLTLLSCIVVNAAVWKDVEFNRLIASSSLAALGLVVGWAFGRNGNGHQKPAGS